MSEWSCLVTVAQDKRQPGIDTARARALLERLGLADSWVQYPPASGRGHGFETRWWQEGEDAMAVGIDATERYLSATAELAIDVRVVLIHITSAAERLTEAVIGLDRRVNDATEPTRWNVMLRAAAPSGSDRRLTSEMRDRILVSLPGPDRSGFARDGLIEVRLWVEATDCVDATDRAAAAFRVALADAGHGEWTIVRAHATAMSEAQRTAYLGVERRVRAADPRTVAVTISR